MEWFSRDALVDWAPAAYRAAKSIEKVAAAIIGSEGGADSVRLQLAERYLQRLTVLADQGTRVVLPADLTRLDSLLDVLDYKGFNNDKDVPPTAT